MFSVFEFAEWTMVSEYDKSGQTRRYRIDANGRKSLIPDDYFEGWYLSSSPNTGLKWAVYVAPIQKRRFRESLWEVATTYLEWFLKIARLGLTKVLSDIAPWATTSILP